MKSVRVPKRLTRIAAYLPKGALFADIGTDHAYLPCYVCIKDNTAQAIAGDINEGPFLRAKKMVQSVGLTDHIEVRKGYGLQVLAQNEADYIVISGMGGELICKIMQNGADIIQAGSRIILQPNADEREVRQQLINLNYTITHEELVEEKGHIYEIIIADNISTCTPLTEKQLLFGPILLQHRTTLFHKKWLKEYKKRQEIIQQMQNAVHNDPFKVDQIVKENTWIKEVLQHDKTGSGC